MVAIDTAHHSRGSLWEHDLAAGLRMLRMGVDTHIITAHAALPLLLGSDRGLLVEMTDGTAEINASYRERVGFFYDLVRAMEEQSGRDVERFR